MVKSLVVLAAVALVGSPAAADDEAKAIFVQSAQAIAKAESITYEVKTHGEGLLSIMPKVDGEVWILNVEEKHAMVRVEASGKESGRDPLKAIFVSDGATMSWLDDETKKLVVRPVAEKRVGLSVTYARECFAGEMLTFGPYEAELESEQIELGEPEEVDGEMCDVVTVLPKGAAQRSRWFISQKDHLPRKIERLLEGQGLSGKRVAEIFKLKVKAKLKPERFEIALPDGYTVDERKPANPTRKPAPGTAGLAGQAKPGNVLKPGSVVKPAEIRVGLNVGNRAPDFELETADGEKVALSSLNGRVAVIAFWGSWNYQCNKASPHLQKLHEQFKDDHVAVYALAVREDDPQNAVSYFSAEGLTFGLLLNADEVATKTYKVRKYPTFYIIDRGGRIVHRSDDASPEGFEKMTAVIQRYVGRAERGEAARQDPN